MSKIQPIIHKGDVAAIVIDGQAIIPDAVPEAELLAVKAKCLYALEIAAGHLPGPYSHGGADAYARAASAQRN